MCLVKALTSALLATFTTLFKPLNNQPGYGPNKGNIMNKATFTFEKATYNGQSGWFATRRIDGVYAGKMFGKTQKAAMAAFEE